MDEDVIAFLLNMLASSQFTVPGDQLATFTDVYNRAVEQVRASRSPS